MRELPKQDERRIFELLEALRQLAHDLKLDYELRARIGPLEVGMRGHEQQK